MSPAALLLRRRLAASSHQRLPHHRSFSSTPYPSLQFLLIAQDHTHPSTYSTRLTHRPAHLARSSTAFKSGNVIMGGATFTPSPSTHD
ncbi:hypothetical protein HDV05_006117, partial [Chytridiales sp. JEL 0842]